MSHTSDARVDSEDRDPYNAEPVRSDPWATGPAHSTPDDQTERFVPEQRDPRYDSDHDGHLYASDTYAEPETTVLPDRSAHEAQGKGVTSTDPAGHAAAKADEAEAEEARAEAEEAKADGSHRREPEVETVALPPAEPVAIVEPVDDRPGDFAVVPVTVPVHDRAGPSEDVADETPTELKPGDVPVEPVTGFFAADAVQGLRDRWREAQLGFVDDPRQSVEDVKALVNEAVDQLTAAVSAQRDQLDTSAGEDTEQYRVAVRRYRSFFDRLLGL